MTFCVQDCKQCPNLVESRKQIVNGVGPQDADIMFVGEAPGKNEDESGEPFVGQSGSKLDDAIEQAGSTRDSVRITNTVRCRPPDNRDPHVNEKENCFRHLQKEIESVDPKLIVPVGKVPAEQLLDRNVSVTKETGDKDSVEYNGQTYTVMICLHPAAMLYNRSLEDDFYNTIEKAICES